jgi:hypothetical protein
MMIHVSTSATLRKGWILSVDLVHVCPSFFAGGGRGRCSDATPSGITVNVYSRIVGVLYSYQSDSELGNRQNALASHEEHTFLYFHYS